MEWVFAHMEDADFNDPLPPPGEEQAAGEVDPAAISTLEAMGFSAEHVRSSLRGTRGGRVKKGGGRR